MYERHSFYYFLVGLLAEPLQVAKSFKVVHSQEEGREEGKKYKKKDCKQLSHSPTKCLSGPHETSWGGSDFEQ